jgi:hypothetical protein
VLDTLSRDNQYDSKASRQESCTTPFRLGDLRRNEPDKLGNRIEDIYWMGAHYAIYRSERGVYVHFSDCPEEEQKQRSRFTKICPELCELRYLTSKMRSRFKISFTSRSRNSGDDLFAHNMAQALMLVMEGKTDQGRKIAEKALAMAVRCVTNDNTIRYVRVSLFVGIASLVLGGVSLWYGLGPSSYIVAGLAGATGAVLSIATRLQAFELKPSDECRMNRWMAGLRVGVGIVAAMVLLLMAATVLGDTVKRILPIPMDGQIPWESAALLGLLGGFAERLIPNLLRRTSGTLELDAGTPVQAVRRDKQRGGGKEDRP